MDTVKLTIDGITAEVAPGATILDAAGKIGCWIPTLCHHKAMEPTGSCRICMVGVRTGDALRVVPSCVTKAAPGMVVETDAPEVRLARQTVAELLLARCPDVPEIRELCEKLGVTDTDLERFDPGEKCILCGRCVRICHEIMEVGAIDFIHRGARRKVKAPFDKPSDICMECGACAFVCPTGAIQSHDLWGHKPAPLKNMFEESLCSRPNIHRPFPSAVPSVPVINRDNCVHFKTGACGVCSAVCEADAIDYDQEEQRVKLRVGAVVLAPGFQRFDAGKLGELGFGRFPNVVSSLQFERILSASGPTQGAVSRPGDGKRPRKIAFLQCVGSRDRRTHTYCSAFCCMQATKEAMVAKDHDENIQSTIFYMDIRAFGKGFEDYRARAEKAGVRYIRSQISAVKEAPGTGDIVLEYIDPDSGGKRMEIFDLLVLSVGIIPTPAGVRLAKRFGVELDEHGFCRMASFSPVDTNVDGVFVTGAFAGPKDIPETVTQASATAGRVGDYLAEAKGTEVQPVTFPEPRDVSGEPPRIGVFICHCGINIAGTVNVNAVEAFARELPGVAYVQRTLFTCSQDSVTNIRKQIEKHKLNRVVVASCSPRTHEPIFQDTLREAGLNPYLFEMANIREHCAWVHKSQPENATEKAKDLVEMVVAKARRLNPLASTSIPVTPVAAVIGGGLSGITSALALAGQGYAVHLVEKSERLGGIAARLHALVTGENIREKLDTLVSAVERHENISVHTAETLKKVTGHVGSFHLELTSGREIQAGIIIVATGAEEAAPEGFLYGKHPGVMTQLELEERFAEGFPSPPKSVVMIQCVGSRDESRPYCSRVCCTQAVKNAIALRKREPPVDVTVLYRDIRTYGTREDYYLEARRLGVRFMRFDENAPPVVTARNGALGVVLDSPDLGATVELRPDWVALSAATAPNPDNDELGGILKVSTNGDGFFQEAHIKLRPVDFASEGVFLTGLAHSPKTVDESIAQSLAAAGKAAMILGKETLRAGAVVARIDPLKCVVCLTCVRLCPYGAPEPKEESGVVEIESIKCQGCGLCAGACPARAIQVGHYRDDQIDAALDTLVEITRRYR